MTDESSPERTAVIVVDMQKDNVGRFCQEIIPNIQLLLKKAREKGISSPVTAGTPTTSFSPNQDTRYALSAAHRE